MGRPRTEAELVVAARDGDERACAVIVRDHQQLMFRCAYVITQDAAEAEDAVQEALVKALRALHRFRPGEPLEPWLLTIVGNEARNRRRAAGRRTGLAVRAQDEQHARVARDATPTGPEGALLAAERRALLLDGLRRLAGADREVLTCRFLLELSEAETAAALDLRVGTVKSRTSRALDRLREVLA